MNSVAYAGIFEDYLNIECEKYTNIRNTLNKRQLFENIIITEANNS